MDFASAGEFWFAPAALMQMRPPSETFDPLMRGMELEHERAHWFQFAGSTIGSLILTLHRAEHVLLLANAGPGRSAHHAFRRAIAEREKVDRHISTDPQLARLGALLDFARLARTHLLHSGYTGSEPSWPLFWETVQMLATATYRVHTGSRAGATELLEFLPVEGALRALKPDLASDGLATVHLFEAGARLSEWAMPLTAGWRSDGESAGISALAHPYIADRLQYGGELYRRAFDVALKKWGEPSSLEDPRAAADAICRWMPTLAACIDIGLNPRVAPIARFEEHERQTVLPGRRFELAVAVAAHLGRPEVWPSESEYCHHRDMIASTAGLGIGELEERGFQHERFDAEFWTEARPDDELLTAMSYFDYLVWAMERMHEFRRDRPRDWAIPGLLSFASDSRGADIRIVLDPENVWSHAPLYWMGNEWGSEARLSESVGFALALDIAACSFAGQATRGTGALTLEDVLPPELACDEAIVQTAFRGLLAGTDWNELRTWTLAIPARPQDDDRSDAAMEALEAEWPAPPLADPEIRLEMDRSGVEQGDLAPLLDCLADLRRSPMSNRWTLDVVFHSYDGDPRGLWGIPEVVEFCRLISATVPDWPWYFRAPDLSLDGSTGFLFTSLAHFQDPRNPSQAEWQQLVHRVIGGFNCGIPDDAGFDAEGDWRDVSGAVIGRALAVIRALRMD